MSFTSVTRRTLVGSSLLAVALVTFGLIYYAFASDARVDDDDGMTAYFEEGAGTPVAVAPEAVPPGVAIENLVVAETERGIRVIGLVRNTSERTIEHVNAFVDLRTVSGTDGVETLEVESLTPILPGEAGLMDAAVTSEVVAGATLQRVVAR